MITIALLALKENITLGIPHYHILINWIIGCIGFIKSKFKGEDQTL
jgi:hypothetical protein